MENPCHFCHRKKSRAIPVHRPKQVTSVNLQTAIVCLMYQALQQVLGTQQYEAEPWSKELTDPRGDRQ